MAKKPVEDAVEPAAVPEGHVKVILKDEHESAIHEERIVRREERQRVYYTADGSSYVAVNQDDDGTYIYRKQTH